jgi:hypothetical protein
MTDSFNGVGLHLGNLPRLSRAQSRSISAENPTGAKGQAGKATEGTGAIVARELGQGWKISPSINIAGHETVTLADIDGSGAIEHIWCTVNPKAYRRLVLRIYWDNETTPSVEVPLGDFFCNGWGIPSNVNSLPISVNSTGGFNSYWEMPFRKHARITLENISPDEIKHFYYQVDYALTGISEDVAYLHVQFRRNNPLPYMDVHTLIEGVTGQGHYVGTYIAWGANNSGWWGEGEVKFYIDGDTDFPTICGTGTEDYFGGAWCFELDGRYQTYSTPYLGFHQLINSDGAFRNQQRFGLYRWHVRDPIRFQQDLRITIQALGWRSQLEEQGRYLPLQDDIASTTFWYQSEPHAPFPQLPDINSLEVI